MFKVGQKVLFTEESLHSAGIEGTVIEVDEDDYAPYLVEFTEDGELTNEWCDEDEIEADGEVIE